MSPREQVLENCRWLFGREVRIITSYCGCEYRGGHFPIIHSYRAIVLPRACSPKLLAQSDVDEKILIQCEYETNDGKSDGIISQLLQQIETKIGEVLKASSDGKLQVDTSALPTNYHEPDDIQAHPAAISHMIEGKTIGDSEKTGEKKIEQKQIEGEKVEETLGEEKRAGKGKRKEESKGKKLGKGLRGQNLLYGPFTKSLGSASTTEQVAGNETVLAALEEPPLTQNQVAKEIPRNQPEAQRDSVYTFSFAETSADIEIEPYMQALLKDHQLLSLGPQENIGFLDENIAGYEQSDLRTDLTPSVSGMSNTATIPILVPGDRSYLDIMVRTEVNRVLGEAFSGLAEQMIGNLPGSR